MYRSRKSILTAYLLWLFLGVLGGHRIYLRRPGSALAYAMLCFGGAAILSISS